MKKHFTVTDFDFEYKKDNVLLNLQCTKDNPKYKLYAKTLKSVAKEYKNHIKPIAYVSIYKKRMYVIMTLGNEIEELIQEAFSDYDYLEAMLLNSLTNQTLYNACNQLFIKLQKKLEKDKLFLSERQEPGQPGLSMEYQKEIYKVIKKNHPKTVVKIIEGYILQPGKTMSYFYDISDEETSGIDHDCNKCDNQYCTFRQYNIKVTYDGKSKVLQAFKGTNILDFLLENKYPIKDSCKGKGKCGKCIIKIKNHKLGTTKEEESKLSSKQLSKYKVLACMHNVESDLEIDISK